MKHFLTMAFLAAFAAVSLPAQAATTWAKSGTFSTVATCSSGSETTPTLATEGFDLEGILGFSVFIESTTGSNFTACTVKAYFYNELSGLTNKWSEAPDSDLSLGAVLSRGYGAFRVPPGVTRIAFLPSGCGQAAKVYIKGAR